MERTRVRDTNRKKYGKVGLDTNNKMKYNSNMKQIIITSNNLIYCQQGVYDQNAVISVLQSYAPFWLEIL